MAAESASTVVKQVREEAFNSAHAIGSFSLGELLVRSRVAEVVNMGPSNAFSSFKENGPRFLTEGKINSSEVLSGLRSLSWLGVRFKFRRC
jgi:hypothetical protein